MKAVSSELGSSERGTHTCAEPVVEDYKSCGEQVGSGSEVSISAHSPSETISLKEWQTREGN
jgi:hypothetical protein